MIQNHQRIALYMEDSISDLSGKMGLGVFRYSRNPIVCMIDSTCQGQDAAELTRIPRRCPIVGSMEQAKDLGAEVMVLGIAPSGGLIPDSWVPTIDRAVALGLCIVNGLHDRLAGKYPSLEPGQWIWDIRVEPPGLGVGTGAARELPNRRVLMVGTDMSVGKMTAGLELFASAQRKGPKSAFVATGQIGIAIMGGGVPLDAIRLDYASDAIEREVMKHQDAKIIVVEGQGSIIHPGSSATLPLLRGTCPTHLILCCRAGQDTLVKVPWVVIPKLGDIAKLYQDMAEACGTYQRPQLAGVAINSGSLSSEEYRFWKNHYRTETGLPTVDVIREGADELLEAVLSS